MLKLCDSQIVGKGSERICYIHPEYAHLCVKVNHSSLRKQSDNELKYLTELAKRGISWRHIPKFHGVVQTNFGDGMVFDLIRDHDEQISETLAHYLSIEMSVDTTRQTVAALQQFRDYLLDQHIMVRDPNASNFALQKPSPDQLRLVLIDGIGNANFAPLFNRINRFLQFKIRRKWNHFERSLVAKHPNNKTLAENLLADKN